jgi:hypothetical protein
MSIALVTSGIAFDPTFILGFLFLAVGAIFIVAALRIKKKAKAQGTAAPASAPVSYYRHVIAAKYGKFNCRPVENAREIDGAHCYVYGSSTVVDVTFDGEGVRFGTLMFYRGKKSAAVAGGMQNMSAASLFLTAAATQTHPLLITWSAVTACYIAFVPGQSSTFEQRRYDMSKYYIVVFNNAEKQRAEWIGFGVLSGGGSEDIHPQFSAKFKEHGLEFCDYTF